MATEIAKQCMELSKQISEDMQKNNIELPVTLDIEGDSYRVKKDSDGIHISIGGGRSNTHTICVSFVKFYYEHFAPFYRIDDGEYCTNPGEKSPLYRSHTTVLECKEDKLEGSFTQTTAFARNPNGIPPSETEKTHIEPKHQIEIAQDVLGYLKFIKNFVAEKISEKEANVTNSPRKLMADVFPLPVESSTTVTKAAPVPQKTFR